MLIEFVYNMEVEDEKEEELKSNYPQAGITILK